MPSIFVSPKSLESFNELRAIEGGKRKKLITQSEMFDEILEEYRKKMGVNKRFKKGVLNEIWNKL